MNFNTETHCKFAAFIPVTREVFGSDNLKFVYRAARLRNRADDIAVFFYKNNVVFGKFDNGKFSRV